MTWQKCISENTDFSRRLSIVSHVYCLAIGGWKACRMHSHCSKDICRYIIRSTMLLVSGCSMMALNWTWVSYQMLIQRTPWTVCIVVYSVALAEVSPYFKRKSIDPLEHQVYSYGMFCIKIYKAFIYSYIGDKIWKYKTQWESVIVTDLKVVMHVSKSI